MPLRGWKFRPRQVAWLPRPAVTVARQPPSYGTPAETTWSGTGAQATSVGGTGSGSLSWNVGDKVYVLAGTSNGNTTVGTPTTAGSNLGAFTALGSPVGAGDVNVCWGHKWVATATGTGSGTISATPVGTSTWGMIAYCVPAAGSDGTGNHAAVGGTNVKTANLSTSQDNSAVLGLFLDWEAAAANGSWTPAGQTQREALQVGTSYTVYAADWPDRGAAGNTDYGRSGGTLPGATHPYTRLAIEVLGTAAAGGTNAPAEAATGSGAALDASVSVAPNAEAATGTGQAPDPLASIGANAEAASGTGAAFDAQVAAGASADVSSGTGTALDPTPAAGVNAEAATGTGAAFDATVSTTNATNAPAEAATGAGAAPDPLIALGGNAEAASGTGTAPDALPSVGAQAGAASGSGTATDLLPAVGANAEAATGTGSAFDATVSTAAQTNASAELASGTGSAPDPTVALAVPAGVATGTGAAPDATASVGANADVASGTGSALDSVIVITVLAGVATGTGTALDVVGQVGREAAGGLASGTGAAFDAALAIAVFADVASGAGQAFDAAVQTVLPFTVGALSAASEPGVTLSANTTPTAVLTATTSRGGPN